MRATAILALYAVCAATLLHPRTLFAALLLLPFCGFVLSGFLNAAHDCVHATHFRSRKLNRIMGAFWCTPLLVNYTSFRYQHLAHHRHTGIDGDTESHALFPSLTSYLYALTGITHWAQTAVAFVRRWRCIYAPTVSSDDRRAAAKADDAVLYFWIVAALALTVAFPRALLFAYWMPMLFYPPAILIWSLPEHYALAGAHDIAKNTRSVKTNGLVRLVLWNANYHAEHHVFPRIPAVDLHIFQESTAMQYGREQTSYLRFHFALMKQLLSTHTQHDQR